MIMANLSIAGNRLEPPLGVKTEASAKVLPLQTTNASLAKGLDRIIWLVDNCPAGLEWWVLKIDNILKFLSGLTLPEPSSFPAKIVYE